MLRRSCASADQAGSTLSPGPAYATVCAACPLAGGVDFSVCPRYFVCDYRPPFCGGAVTGFPDGTYLLSVFVDSGTDGDPFERLPASGDALPSTFAGALLADCSTETLVDGEVIAPVNFVTRFVLP